MQPSLSIVAPCSPEVADRVMTECRQSAYLDVLAECLYETAALCGRLTELAPEWRHLSQHDKARYRYEAQATLNRLDAARRHEAKLRAREQVADSHFGRDYPRLAFPLQVLVAESVHTAVETYLRVLEGFYTPLPAFRAAELEPAAPAREQ